MRECVLSHVRVNGRSAKSRPTVLRLEHLLSRWFPTLAPTNTEAILMTRFRMLLLLGLGTRHDKVTCPKPTSIVVVVRLRWQASIVPLTLAIGDQVSVTELVLTRD